MAHKGAFLASEALDIDVCHPFPSSWSSTGLLARSHPVSQELRKLAHYLSTWISSR